MRELYCSCYKISDRIKFSPDESWRGFLRFGSGSIESILRYNCEGKELIVFKSGSVSFVNCFTDEIKTLLNYIKSRFEVAPYQESFDNIESIRACFGDEGDGSALALNDELYDDFRKIAPFFLAKSVELALLEGSLDELIDRSEQVISLIKKNKYRFFKKSFAKSLSEMNQFYFRLITNSLALDEAINGIALSGELLEQLNGVYELDDRLHVFSTKLDIIKKLLHNYREASFDSNMLGYYKIEVLMLVLFPAGYILGLRPELISSIAAFLKGLFVF